MIVANDWVRPLPCLHRLVKEGRKGRATGGPWARTRPTRRVDVTLGNRPYFAPRTLVSNPFVAVGEILHFTNLQPWRAGLWPAGCVLHSGVYERVVRLCSVAHVAALSRLGRVVERVAASRQTTVRFPAAALVC